MEGEKRVGGDKGKKNSRKLGQALVLFDISVKEGRVSSMGHKAKNYGSSRLSAEI